MPLPLLPPKRTPTSSGPPDAASTPSLPRRGGREGLSAVIAHHVRDYLASRTALDQLEDALISYSCDAHVWAPEPLADLLADVERVLWHVRSGQLTEYAGRTALKAVLEG